MSTESFLISNSVLSTHYSALSSDDLVRPRQYPLWDHPTHLLRRLEINDQLKFCRLLDGDLGRLGALENLIHVSRGAAIQIHNTGAVAHQPSSFAKISPVVYRRNPIFCCEFGNLGSMRIQNGTCQYENCISTFLGCMLEYSFNIFGAYDIQILKLHCERSCGEFRFF